MQERLLTLQETCKSRYLSKYFEEVEAFKDRLTRFGFKYLEQYFSSYGVRIEVINGEELKDEYQEIVEDLIALVSSFAEKLYGLRSHKYEKVVEGVKQLIID